MWKSGNSSDSDVTLIQAAADTLRQQYGAKILAITAAGHYSNGDLALTGAEELIFAFDGWREAKPKRLAEVADKICEVCYSFQRLIQYFLVYGANIHYAKLAIIST